MTRDQIKQALADLDAAWHHYSRFLVVTDDLIIVDKPLADSDRDALFEAMDRFEAADKAYRDLASKASGAFLSWQMGAGAPAPMV